MGQLSYLGEIVISVKADTVISFSACKKINKENPWRDVILYGHETFAKDVSFKTGLLE